MSTESTPHDDHDHLHEYITNYLNERHETLRAHTEHTERLLNNTSAEETSVVDGSFDPSNPPDIPAVEARYRATRLTATDQIHFIDTIEDSEGHRVEISPSALRDERRRLITTSDLTGISAIDTGDITASTIYRYNHGDRDWITVNQDYATSSTIQLNYDEIIKHMGDSEESLKNFVSNTLASVENCKNSIVNNSRATDSQIEDIKAISESVKATIQGIISSEAFNVNNSETRNRIVTAIGDVLVPFLRHKDLVERSIAPDRNYDDITSEEIVMLGDILYDYFLDAITVRDENTAFSNMETSIKKNLRNSIFGSISGCIQTTFCGFIDEYVKHYDTDFIFCLSTVDNPMNIYGFIEKTKGRKEFVSIERSKELFHWLTSLYKIKDCNIKNNSDLRKELETKFAAVIECIMDRLRTKSDINWDYITDFLKNPSNMEIFIDTVGPDANETMYIIFRSGASNCLSNITELVKPYETRKSFITALTKEMIKPLQVYKKEKCQLLLNNLKSINDYDNSARYGETILKHVRALEITSSLLDKVPRHSYPFVEFKKCHPRMFHFNISPFNNIRSLRIFVTFINIIKKFSKNHALISLDLSNCTEAAISLPLEFVFKIFGRKAFRDFIIERRISEINAVVIASKFSNINKIPENKAWDNSSIKRSEMFMHLSKYDYENSFKKNGLRWGSDITELLPADIKAYSLVSDNFIIQESNKRISNWVVKSFNESLLSSDNMKELFKLVMEMDIIKAFYSVDKENRPRPAHTCYKSTEIMEKIVSKFIEKESDNFKEEDAGQVISELNKDSKYLFLAQFGRAFL